MWFNSVSSSPEVAFASNWIERNNPSPDPFYGKQIFVFAPHITFKDVKITCYHCSKKEEVSAKYGQHGSKTGIRLKGWTASPRKCYGRDDVIYVFTRVYQCYDCGVGDDGKKQNRKLYSYKPTFLTGLPWHVQRSFPFLFTHRAGIETSLFQDLISLMETSSGIAGFRKIMKERYMLRYTHLELSFLSFLMEFKRKATLRGTQLLFGEKVMRPTLLNSSHFFSEFKDPNGYYGQIPSRKHLFLQYFNFNYLEKFLRSLIILDSLKRKKAYYQLEMQRRGGKVLMVDDSFKISKHIQKVGDAKLIDGLHTGMNEYGEIRLLHFIQSTAFSDKEESLKNYNLTANAYKILPEVLFVDNCCSVRSSYEKALPSLCKNLKTWKLLPLPEDVVYSKPKSSPDEINTLLQPIVDHLRKTPDKKFMHIGLDTEWPINYGVGVESKIAVIQIGLFHPVQEKNYVYVFSVASFNELPGNLMYLLQSPKVKKYGNRIISADHRKL